MSKLSKELVFLDIFYSDLTYIDIQTNPAYDFLTLVCDICGALGLILGATLITIVEFVQLFVQLFNEIVTSAKLARMQRYWKVNLWSTSDKEVYHEFSITLKTFFIEAQIGMKQNNERLIQLI